MHILTVHILEHILHANKYIYLHLHKYNIPNLILLILQPTILLYGIILSMG